LPHAPVVVAPKEDHAAWVVARDCLSAPGDEKEVETLDVAKARLLMLEDSRRYFLQPKVWLVFTVCSSFRLSEPPCINPQRASRTRTQYY